MADDGFAWWVSRDQERWSPAGDTTRSGAIEIGTEEFNGDGFYICEARVGQLDLRIAHFRIVEMLEFMNEERVDPDGDGSLFSSPPSREQLASLEQAVEAAVRGWFDGNGFSTNAWAFAATRNEEYIPSERLYTSDDRARCHALLAWPPRAAGGQR